VAIETTHLKRCDLISLSGRFDSNTAPALEQALRASIEGGTFHLVLDMAGVEFFGSSAIRALIMAYKQCRRWNRGDVYLAGLPPQIAHVLDIAGILPLIRTFDDRIEAVGSF
jgi:anti-sigma B factor antagonist